ncbi:hypothetical protein Ahy_A05g022154 isoform C [Arachis hypogaea]|uniref:Uncharacterized protein n=1 Tax=Arachis hypogaea TaxID=3818 RepID=A0A445CZT9_ARAHY|nr:hypothetical protein Ahy_A05g022154 isoform C [Arachis hypogaea]
MCLNLAACRQFREPVRTGQFDLVYRELATRLVQFGVEMILQALEYETEHGKVLDEFFISTAGKFQTEIGKNWAAEIISRRKSLSKKRMS